MGVGQFDVFDRIHLLGDFCHRFLHGFPIGDRGFNMGEGVVNFVFQLLDR